MGRFCKTHVKERTDEELAERFLQLRHLLATETAFTKPGLFKEFWNCKQELTRREKTGNPQPQLDLPFPKTLPK